SPFAGKTWSQERRTALRVWTVRPLPAATSVQRPQAGESPVGKSAGRPPAPRLRLLLGQGRVGVRPPVGLGLGRGRRLLGGRSLVGREQIVERRPLVRRLGLRGAALGGLHRLELGLGGELAAL